MGVTAERHSDGNGNSKPAESEVSGGRGNEESKGDGGKD